MQTISMDSKSTPPRTQDGETPKKKRGALLVYERMRDEIMWMQIEPGSALDEVALASKYEVSRTPIREALLLLANEGFVQFLQNRTTIVAPLTLHNIPALLDTFLLLARGLLRSVAMNGTARPDDLSDFIETYRHGLAVNDTRGAFEAQLGLYKHLAALSENRFLEKYFLEAQDASVRLKQLYFFPDLTPLEQEKAVNRLRAVVDAVTQADPEASDVAVVQSIMFEAGIVQRRLGPRFGHKMSIVSPTTVTEQPS
ncbi:GntR family transcriptional regulator [Yoonia sp. F2084L]|nr:GntR family transcriptional regulator [Yoonia sp. F2084L]